MTQDSRIFFLRECVSAGAMGAIGAVSALTLRSFAPSDFEVLSKCLGFLVPELFSIDPQI